MNAWMWNLPSVNLYWTWLLQVGIRYILEAATRLPKHVGLWIKSRCISLEKRTFQLTWCTKIHSNSGYRWWTWNNSWTENINIKRHEYLPRWVITEFEKNIAETWFGIANTLMGEMIPIIDTTTNDWNDNIINLRLSRQMFPDIVWLSCKI